MQNGGGRCETSPAHPQRHSALSSRTALHPLLCPYIMSARYPTTFPVRAFLGGHVNSALGPTCEFASEGAVLPRARISEEPPLVVPPAEGWVSKPQRVRHGKTPLQPKPPRAIVEIRCCAESRPDACATATKTCLTVRFRYSPYVRDTHRCRRIQYSPGTSLSRAPNHRFSFPSSSKLSRFPEVRASSKLPLFWIPSRVPPNGTNPLKPLHLTPCPLAPSPQKYDLRNPRHVSAPAVLIFGRPCTMR
ncbi:hypothetical protein B0H11DRAFT_893971 [Mycena galericulata]|nr:hypothetical protein B0H11DRAFT_893971 [Mycena galericulata]